MSYQDKCEDEGSIKIKSRSILKEGIRRKDQEATKEPGGRMDFRSTR